MCSTVLQLNESVTLNRIPVSTELIDYTNGLKCISLLFAWYYCYQCIIMSYPRCSWYKFRNVLLLWRHNGHHGVSNHQPHDSLINRSLRRRSNETSKLRVTGFCAGDSPVTGEFPVVRKWFQLAYLIRDLCTCNADQFYILPVYYLVEPDIFLASLVLRAIKLTEKKQLHANILEQKNKLYLIGAIRLKNSTWAPLITSPPYFWSSPTANSLEAVSFRSRC